MLVNFTNDLKQTVDFLEKADLDAGVIPIQKFRDEALKNERFSYNWAAI